MSPLGTADGMQMPAILSIVKARYQEPRYKEVVSMHAATSKRVSRPT